MSSITFNVGRTNYFQNAIEKMPGVVSTGLRISDRPGLTITVDSEQSRELVDSLVSDSIDGQPVEFLIDPRRMRKEQPSDKTEGRPEPLDLHPHEPFSHNWSAPTPRSAPFPPPPSAPAPRPRNSHPDEPFSGHWG